MRIIAGSLGGRQFKAPRGHRTHPMSDKARGGLFNTLGDLSGLTILDAFAGSGALSFEAVSHGASQALAIDLDAHAQRALADNIKQLKLGSKVRLIKASAHAWLSTSQQKFDIVLLDPPFNDLQINLLANLAERTKVGGLLVASLPPTAQLELDKEFELLKTKSYGDNQLVFWRKIS